MSRRATILVAGAINTDLVATMVSAPAPGETVTGTSFAIHGGGKGANQAVSAARSGARVAMLGAVGADAFGSARLADLEREGIDISWIRERSNEPSGVALIFVEEHGENRIAYVPGATTSISVDDSAGAIAAVRPSFLLATNESPHESLRALVAKARQAGSTVVLNAAPDPERAADLLPDVDIAILNAGEAARILARSDELDPYEAIASLRALGPATVILTLGAAGVVGNERDRIFVQRPPLVEAVDTTGAGDTFCGAFTAELWRGSSITDAARHGVLASALSVTIRGAQAGIPTRQQVKSFVDML